MSTSVINPLGWTGIIAYTSALKLPLEWDRGKGDEKRVNEVSSYELVGLERRKYFFISFPPGRRCLNSGKGVRTKRFCHPTMVFYLCVLSPVRYHTPDEGYPIPNALERLWNVHCA